MLTRTTAPDALIELTEAKTHLSVGDDNSDHDTLITRLINAAMARLDGHRGLLGRAILSQIWTETFAGFASPLRLGMDPVISLDSIAYYDSDNAAQTLDASEYYLHKDAKGAYVKLHYGNAWPDVYARDDAITVTSTCGADADDVQDIKVAALLLIGHLYYNREATGPDQSFETVHGFYDLIAPYRRVF